MPTNTTRAQADDEHEGSFARGAMFAVLFSIPLYLALWLVIPKQKF